MVEVGSARARLLLDTQGFKKGIRDAEGQMGRFQKKTGVMSKAVGGIAKAAKAGAAVVGTAFTAMAISSVKTGMKFDKAMSQVAATLGKSTKDIKDLRDFAIKMGEKTKFSATEAADALNYMALAGYDSKKSMEMLPKVLNLAAAGNIDLAKASDMVTDTQTAFGISTKRTGKMVDEMAKAASTGNTSVEQLGDAFLTVGGLAKELNGGMVKMKDGTTKSTDGVQELEIALTAMADAGIKGSEAGTHMRNMLLKLSSPTKDGAAMFEKLGVSVFDSEGKMRSLQDIFGDLNKSMSNLTQQEKLQAISDIFNTRDTASAEALLSAVESDWDGIGESILNAKGAAQKMADTQLDNLAGDVTLAKSAFESLQIAISDKSTGALRGFVQLGTKGIKEVTKAVKTGDFEGLFRKMGDEFVNLRDRFIKALPDITKTGADIAVGIGEKFFTALPGTIEKMTQSAGKIGQALIDTILNVFSKIDVPAIIGQSLDIAEGLSSKIREGAGKVVDAGITLIKRLAKGLADSFPVIIEKVPTIISNIAGVINDNAPKILKAGVDIIVTLGKGLIKAIPTLVKNIPKIIKAIWDVFTAVNWWNLGKNIITGLITGIKNMIPKLPGVAKNIVSTIWNFVKTLPSKLGTIGVDMIQHLGSGVKGMLGLIKTVFSGLLSLILGIVKSLPSKFLALGKNVLKLLIQGVKAMWSLVISTFTTLGGKIVDEVKKIPKKMLNIGKDIVGGIAKGIKNKAASAVNAIKGVGSKIVNGITGFFDIHSPSKLMETKVGHNIVDGICKGISNRTKKGVKTAEQMSKEIYKAAVNKLETIKASKKYVVDYDDEAKYWKKVMGAVKKGSDGYVSAFRKYTQAMNRLRQQEKKKKEELIKAEKKRLKEEKKIIEEEKKIREKQEKEEEARYRKLLALEKEFAEKSKKIQEDLKNKIKELNAKYKAAFDERVSQILSGTSLFSSYTASSVKSMEDIKKAYNDALEVFEQAGIDFANGTITLEEYTAAQEAMNQATENYKESIKDYSPEGLIENLQSQVDAIQRYNDSISELEDKSILPPEMIEEIKKMGMDATGQIEALNNMTDEQLAEYVELWKQKYALANEQAKKELEPLADETAKAIEKAKKKANNKLDELRRSYEKKMEKIRQSGVKTGKRAGKETVEAVIIGINSKKTELNKAMDDILQSVTSKYNQIMAMVNAANQAAASVGNSGGNSHRDGLNYVPYDGYRAQLHEGEMVLTRNEAEEYKKGSKGGNYNFTFNSPKAIDPYEANKLFKETVRKMNEGFA